MLVLSHVPAGCGCLLLTAIAFHHLPPPVTAMQPLSFEAAVEHWRGLLRGLAAALHSLLAVKGSWPALKATLVDFASKNHHAIVRSAMHLQLIKPIPPPPQPAAGSAALAPNGKAGGIKAQGAEPPAWCPGQHMVCREFGVSLSSAPGPEAALFIEQAAIAVGGLGVGGWGEWG